MKYSQGGKEQLDKEDFQRNVLFESDWIKQTQDDPCDTMMPVQKPKGKKDE